MNSFEARPDKVISTLPDGKTNQNPTGIGFIALLREDLANHYGSIWEQGFWAIAVHRFGNWRMGIRPKLLRFPFSLLHRVLNKCVEWSCGISLPYTVKLGRRVRIWHHGGMILHARSIGDDCAGRRPQTPHQLQEPDWPRHSAYYRYTQQGMYTMHGRPSRHGWIMPVG